MKTVLRNLLALALLLATTSSLISQILVRAEQPNIKPPYSPPFEYGLVSGDPTNSTVLLWTRAQVNNLTVEISSNNAFQAGAFIQSIQVPAPNASEDFTVTVLVNVDPQLIAQASNRRLYYRFVSGSSVSPVGSFVLAPTNSTNLRFGWSGDSDGTPHPDGTRYFNDFDTLGSASNENLDFFVYLGDTIYADSAPYQDIWGDAASSRQEFWHMYKMNRAMDNTQRLVLNTPLYVQWDDHEIYDNWNERDNLDQNLITEGAIAFRDYWPIQNQTFLNLTTTTTPEGCIVPPKFRYIQYGPDIDIFILDERSCRVTNADIIREKCSVAEGNTSPYALYPYPLVPQSVREELTFDTSKIIQRLADHIPDFAGINFEVLAGDVPEGCVDALNDPSRTLLGQAQKDEFKRLLLASNATYKIVVTQVPIQNLILLPYDRWEGFPVEREEILTFIRDNNITNVIFLAADVHLNSMNSVFVNIWDRRDVAVAHEVVTGPIAYFSPIGLIRYYVPEIPIVHDEIVEEFREYANEVLDSGYAPYCRQLDEYSYGTLQFYAQTKQLVVELKNGQGQVLRDENNPDVQCRVTFPTENNQPLPETRARSSVSSSSATAAARSSSLVRLLMASLLVAAVVTLVA